MRHNAQGFFVHLGAKLKDFNKKIADTLKALRKQKAWSLDFTSKKTGVSKAMLGQIERGESAPTIATLWKIASGFNVSFSSFIEEIEPKKRAQQLKHYKGKLETLHPQDDLIKVLPLFPFDKNLNFEVFIIQLFPGCEHLSPPHQSGVIEHIVAAQGNVEVLVNGKWHKVKEHAGISFPADKAHGYRNKEKTPVIIHDIIHYTL